MATFLITMFHLVQQPLAYAKEPIFLVPGYGPRQVVDMSRISKALVRRGYEEQKVYQIFYNKDLGPDEVALQISGRIKRKLAKFREKKFSLITHSLGSFTGLYAAMKEELGGQLRRYVSLAGVLQGQYGELPLVCRYTGCGKTLPRLIPYRNPFLIDFLETYESALRQKDLCMVYSPDDGMVMKPYDSSRLTYSRNYELSGVKHLDFIKDKNTIEQVLDLCGF